VLEHGAHLRPIRASDVEIDYPAVMGSRERLWAKYGRAWGWPPETMTLAQDRRDLEHHEREIAAHQSFNYALLGEQESELLGCVYIDPAPDQCDSDALVSWWVVDECMGTSLQGELDRFVPAWVTSAWPFRRPAFEFDTPHGLARAHLRIAERPGGALVLGHGAGGGVQTPDLLAAAHAAQTSNMTVALVEQPYLVAGRRTQAPAVQLDESWLAVLKMLGDAIFEETPLLVGGRSAGARVACRTAAQAGASAVLCLAFPLHPPGNAAKSRLEELDAVRVPMLVIQGERDPFGMPPPGARRTVVRVPGSHSLTSTGAIETAVSDWLATQLTRR
jgi:predicted alpha/beta-hydrolase family hydrolase